MDIKEHINLKIEELNRKAQGLKLVNFSWELPIIFDCSALTSIYDASLVKNHPALLAGNANPGIYYFKILNSIDSSTVVKALNKYKSRKERSCPKIDNKRSTDSIFLYCGSVRGGSVNLNGRFIQHLGYSNKDLYSLQLIHWAKELGLKLEYNYAFLKLEERHLTELVEASLTTALKPLVGKSV